MHTICKDLVRSLFCAGFYVGPMYRHTGIVCLAVILSIGSALLLKHWFPIIFSKCSNTSTHAVCFSFRTKGSAYFVFNSATWPLRYCAFNLNLLLTPAFGLTYRLLVPKLLFISLTWLGNRKMSFWYVLGHLLQNVP